MANSRLFQFRYSYERDLVDLYLKATVGAAGALTITAQKGITSVTRNSAGNYTILLKDLFNLFMIADSMFNSGASAPAAPNMNIVATSVTSAQTIQVQFRNLAGAATDPASGEIMHIHIVCRNAST